MDTMCFPRIYCPFTSGINPHVEVAGKHTLDWAMHFRLVQRDTADMHRFLGSRFAWLAARAYPLVGLEELSLLSDRAAWLLLFDDQFDNGPIGGQPEYIQALLGT